MGISRRKAYLAGAIEQVADRGLGWRREFATALAGIGVDSVIPNDEEERRLPVRIPQGMKTKRDLGEFKTIFRQRVILPDLAVMDSCDMVVVRWDGEFIAGTAHECGHAFMRGQPVLLVTPGAFSEVPDWLLACSSMEFHTLGELIDHLKKENSNQINESAGIVIVVDIDGTVCDSSALINRLTCKHNKAVDLWDDSQMLSCLAEARKQPVVPGAEVLPILMRRGYQVVFLTGRSEGLGDSPDNGRLLTIEWLRKTFGMAEGIGLSLFMRPRNDKRPNADVKLEMFQLIRSLHPHKSFVFLDDDPAVLAIYARYGLALKAPECWGALSHLLVR
jgi:nucleoside 2-deoxyribosyltransferase